MTHASPGPVIDFHRPLNLPVSVVGASTITAVTLFYRPWRQGTFQSSSIGPAPSGLSLSAVGTTQINAASLQPGALMEYFFEVGYLDFGVPLTYQWPTAPFSYVLEVRRRLEQGVNPAGGTFFLEDGDSADGRAYVTVPPGALAAPARFLVEPLDSGDPSSVPRRLAAPSAAPGDNQYPLAAVAYSVTTEPSVTFRKPVTLGLLYSDLDSDGVVDGTDFLEVDLKAFWWDGVEWRFAAKGEVDAAANVVSFPAAHGGLFALFPSAGAPTLYRPKEQILTPNGDGQNDAAVFDGFASGLKIRIFDASGRLVREFSDRNVWDAADKDGRPVESGLYIYQVESPEGLLSGTLTVAK